MKKQCLSLLLCAALLLSCLPAAAEETELSSDLSSSGETELLSEEQTDGPDENMEPQEITESEGTVEPQEIVELQEIAESEESTEQPQEAAEPEAVGISLEELESSEEQLPSQTEETVEEEALNKNEEISEEEQQVTEKDPEGEEESPEEEQEPMLPVTYMLTFLDGLTGAIISQTELAANVSLADYEFQPELPEGYSKEAYSFNGWYVSDGERFEWDYTMPEENLTLTAKWGLNEFQVRVYPNLENLTEDTELLGSQTVEYGGYADEPILAEYEDRELEGWYRYSNGDIQTFNFENDEIYANTDIYAVWKQTKLVVEVIHHIETAEDYDIYESIQLEDQQIGEEITVEPLEISGYVYNAHKSVASGLITTEDYTFDLYYDRVPLPYEFQFLNADTGESLLESVSGTALYQEEVQLQAPEIPGYSVMNEDVCTLVIEMDTENPEQNVGIFYYQEDRATLSYRLVGDIEGAELSSEQEELFVFSGEAEGTSLNLQEGYLFGGWYSDEACTEPVPEEWIDADSALIPGKALYVYENSDIHYADAVYYAKIIYGCADLVISASSAEEDCTQTFLYHVRGTDINTETIDLVVAVTGGRAVIRDLPIGTYSIREITAWSWRYRTVEDELNITINTGDETIAAFAHERSIDHWLSDVADFIRKWIAGSD